MHCGESGLQTRWDSEVAFDRLRAGAATAGEPATRRRSPRSTSCRWLPAHRFQRNPGDASGTRGGGESSSPLTRLVPLQGVPCLELCWIQWRAVGRRTQGAEAGLPISQPGEVCPERQTCFIGLPLETIAHDFGDLDGSQVSRKLALATSAEARGSDCARWVGHPPGSRNDRLISAPAGRYRALLLATPIHLAGRSGDAALFAAKMAASSTCPGLLGFRLPLVRRTACARCTAAPRISAAVSSTSVASFVPKTATTGWSGLMAITPSSSCLLPTVEEIVGHGGSDGVDQPGERQMDPLRNGCVSESVPTLDGDA